MKQMHRKTIGLFCGIAAALVLLVCAGVWYYVQSGALMERAAGTIASTLTDQLGTETQVGSMESTSLHDATLHDIAIYDNQAQCIVRAPEARVHLRLLSAFQLGLSFLAPAKEAHLKGGLAGLQIILGQIPGRGWHKISIIQNLGNSRLICFLPILIDMEVFFISPLADKENVNLP